MAYQAPDPEQFATMKEGYAYLAPAAAMAITLPAFVFSGPCHKLARIIYLRQCNPGEIVQGGARWLQVAQQFDEAREAFQARLDSLESDDWIGEDRDAFDGKADDIITQLTAISGFALHLGVSMMMIGFTLAILIPILLTIATVLFAHAVMFLAVRGIVPAGPIMALAWRTSATTLATSWLVGAKTLDKAVDAASIALAGFIGGNMVGTWVNMASAGNFINPINTMGSTLSSLFQGVLNLLVIKFMAPGKTGLPPTGVPGAVFLGGTAFQGAWNFAGAGADSHEARTGEKPPNAMKDAGVDAFNYDFTPDKLDEATRSGDAPHSWRNNGWIPPMEVDSETGTGRT